MDDLTLAYLAGYLERGGAVRIYVNRDRSDNEVPLIDTEYGAVSPIESAGIYVRVRASDETVLRIIKKEFGGKLTSGQWQGWNTDAAVLLKGILPYLKTGRRKATVMVVLEFHEYMEEKRETTRMPRLFFSAEDVAIVTRYERTLREITESR